jgi:hypothetical protein
VEGFVRVGDTLINTQRLMAIVLLAQDHFRAGWYLAVFDTEQKVLLEPEAGHALAEHCQSLSLGTMAISCSKAI